MFSSIALWDNYFIRKPLFSVHCQFQIARFLFGDLYFVREPLLVHRQLEFASGKC